MIYLWHYIHGPTKASMLSIGHYDISV